MPGCVLRASGDRFQPEDFLQKSTLIACQVFHKGEHKSKNHVWNMSGINIVVSDGSGDQVSQQIKDSIEFLKNNKEELAQLRQCEGLEAMELDFGVNRNEVFPQCIIIPLELISLVAELEMGLELSIYPEG